MTFSPMNVNSPAMCTPLIDQTGYLAATGDMGAYSSMDSPPNHGAESPIQLSKQRLFVVVYKVIYLAIFSQ